MNMKIKGTGSALPPKVLTNKDLEAMVETSDEWIRERTGIESRHISEKDTVASLATKACQKALENANQTAESVELIIVATCSPEMLLPCCACQVQKNLDARKAVCFDVNAACPGFLFGLQTAFAYLSAGFYRNALIVGSEVLSKIVDWEDRGTCILFGDGAGAVYVEACEETHFLSFVQGSDGSKGEVLSCNDRSLFGAQNLDRFVRMDGREVYKFATRQVPLCMEEALKKANLSVADVDFFVLHQANLRILEAISKRIGAEMKLFPYNVNRVGNMSSAAIPVLLDELNQKGVLLEGMKLVLSGFGAGLTYGACVVCW